jgi:hypothetical protein
MWMESKKVDKKGRKFSCLHNFSVTMSPSSSYIHSQYILYHRRHQSSDEKGVVVVVVDDGISKEN